jgi:outer membrane immunogenic protein
MSNRLGLVICGVAFSLAASGSALAADMAVKAPPPQPAPTPVFNWTGLYIGGHIGELWAHKELDWLDIANGFIINPHTSVIHDFSGLSGGIQGGFNAQAGNVLLGVEGQWSWTDANGSSAPCPFPNATGGSSCGSKMGCDARAPVRFGVE